MRSPLQLVLVLLLVGMASSAAMASAVAVHPNSRSHTVLRVDGLDASAVVRCQFESVVEVLDVDPDGNGIMDEVEFQARREAIGAYVLARYGLLIGPPDEPEPLAGRVVDVALITDDLDALFSFQFVDVSLAWTLPEPVDALHVEMDLFTVTSPRHTDSGVLRWGDAEPSEYRLWAGRPRVLLSAPPRPPEPSLVEDLRAGAQAVWAGARHLVLVLALLVAAPRLRTFALLLAAFTAMTAVAAVFVAQGAVSPDPASLSLGVALSLVWLGGLTILRRTARPPWAEALLFGLLYGASVVGVGTLGRPLPGDDPLRLSAFLTGAMGVWMATAAVALLLLRPLPRRASVSAGPRDTQLVPGYARDAVSLAAALLGTWWAASQLAV